MLTLDKIRNAAEVLENVIHETPLIRAQGFDVACDLYFKLENLQPTGSFKLRGAGYKLAILSEEEKARGVVTCSTGNHALGVALAASKLGIPALICMPDSVPITRVEAVKRYGAQVCLVPGDWDAAHQRALERRDELGHSFIHPFEDEDVIAGQGTIALEINEELNNVDAVIVPIGGGSLISGVAFALKAINPNIRVYGVQAAGAPSMYNSVRDEKIVRLDRVSTIADGIAVKQPGETAFWLVNEYIDDLALVTDDEIAAAVLALMENQKMIVEGAGAASVAAAMFGKFPIRGKKVVCLISGGNLDMTRLPHITERGLIKSGRSASLRIDASAQLQDILRIVAACGGSVTGFRHERADDACLCLTMETRNAAHVQEIIQALQAEGIQILG